MAITRVVARKWLGKTICLKDDDRPDDKKYYRTITGMDASSGEGIELTLSEPIWGGLPKRLKVEGEKMRRKGHAWCGNYTFSYEVR